MKMTIDKTIEFFKGLECHTPQAKDARDVVIETMRKYKKIEEIVSNNELEWGNTSVRANALLKVKKVVEDGQNTIKD